MSYQRKSVYQVVCKQRLLINCQVLGPEAETKDGAYKLASSDGWFAVYGQDAKCPECRTESYNRSRMMVDSP